MDAFFKVASIILRPEFLKLYSKFLTTVVLLNGFVLCLPGWCAKIRCAYS